MELNGNNLLWFFAFLFLMGGNGFGGLFGNRGPMGPAPATQQDVTEAVNNQSIQAQLNALGIATSNNNFEMAKQFMDQNLSMQSQNNTNLVNIIQGFNSVVQQMQANTANIANKIDQLGFKMDSCCCEIKTQMLQNRLDDANAKIVPPFDIPAYEPLSTVSDDGERKALSEDEDASSFNVAQNPSFEKTLFEGGFGVVKNVGTIKSIKVTTLGMNFPHGLYVHLTDNDNVERRYFMGYLGFDGWKELRWNNPQYISEIRNREIRVYPIYPRGTPFIKFAGFEVTRDAAHIGGDFIGYFKDVKIIYDKAILTSDRDIADEDLWGIIGKKESDRQAAEMSKFGNKQVNRYLEKSKLATEEDFVSSLYEDSDSNAQSNAGQAADAK